MSTPPKSRRAEYAEATRAGIVDAARRLFAQQGYFATTVNEIAEAARVAPTTVYAVAGGKVGLIRTLVDIWSQAPIISQTRARQAKLTDPDEILRQSAASVRFMREEYGDIMRVVLATAPQDKTVDEGLQLATKRYRGALTRLATRLRETGGLHPDMTVHEATDTLWFYFGYTGFFTLVDDNGWSYERAERWLVSQARMALRQGNVSPDTPR